MKKAVLMIHGFAGGTYDYENLANFLQLDSKFDVFFFTLPGHGGSRKDVKSSEWISYSEKQLKNLIKNGYKEIYLIGHSMGGVIATYLASKYKEVKRLVLAAPAFEYFKLKEGKLDVVDSIKLVPKIKDKYDNNQIINKILKLPISAVNEFINLVNKYKGYINDIEIPVLIIHGLDDLIVPSSSSSKIYSILKSKVKKIIYFKKVGHELFDNFRNDEINKEVLNFLKAKKLKSEEKTI